MKVDRFLSTRTGEVITIRPDQTIREAASLMFQHNIGAVVVLDTQERIVGILSERDIVRKAVTHDRVFDMAVRDVMTADVITAVAQDDLMSVAHTMTEHRFRHLPIVDDQNNLIGIISIGDVLKAQRDQYRGEIDTLETQIMAGDQ